MTKPEATPRAGEDMSPVQDLKSAITDFVCEFKQFSNGVHAKLQQQEDRKSVV